PLFKLPAEGKELDDAMRSFAEKVFASEVKDEGGRQEISPFDVDEICPISHHEMQAHILHMETLKTVNLSIPLSEASSTKLTPIDEYIT
uniref:AMP deaminase, skeletal muscle (Fragments) n=1 Tax=Oryctolagus cuniculus TaxID=9986 RepID=Q7M3H8_RABIT